MTGPPEYTVGTFIMTVIAGMPDGDRAITTRVEDGDLDAYLAEVARSAGHLYGQRETALRRKAEQENQS